MRKKLIVGLALLACLVAVPAMGYADIEMENIDGVYHVTVTCTETGLTGGGTFLTPSDAVSAATAYCAEQ